MPPMTEDERAKLLEKFTNKAQRSKVQTLRNVSIALKKHRMQRGGAEDMKAVQGFFAKDWDSILSEFFAKEASPEGEEWIDKLMNNISEALEEKLTTDNEIRLKAEAEPGGFAWRIETGNETAKVYLTKIEVVDGKVLETYKVTQARKVHRVMVFNVTLGELPRLKKASAAYVISTLLRGTDSGTQHLDLTSSVKVMEILANDGVDSRIKALALYSKFDQTLYNIDWSRDGRISMLYVPQDVYRKDKIKNYEKQMAEIFAQEIRA